MRAPHSLELLATTVALAVASGAPTAVAAPPADVTKEAEPRAHREDFSTVTTHAKAERLVAQGRLVRVLFFPAELGGPDTPENRGYLPPAIEDARAEFIASLRRMTAKKQLDSLKVEPAYKGDSIVPSAIRMIASKREQKGVLDATIEVW